jgi:hypothetical protein
LRRSAGGTEIGIQSEMHLQLSFIGMQGKGIQGIQLKVHFMKEIFL